MLTCSVLETFIRKNSSKSTKLYIFVGVIGIALVLLGSGLYFTMAKKAEALKTAEAKRAVTSDTKVAGAHAPTTDTAPTTTPTTPTTPAQSAPAPTPAPKPYVAPKAPPSTPAAPSSGPDGNGVYSTTAAEIYLNNKVMALVNNERAALGLAGLRYNGQLAQAAGIRISEEAILSFVGTDHVRPDGRTFDTVFPQVGFTGYYLVGENLLWGYQQTFAYDQASLDAMASQMFTSWKNSPEHYAQIKNPKYNLTGLGMILINQNGHTYYFGIQEFAQK